MDPDFNHVHIHTGNIDSWETGNRAFARTKIERLFEFLPSVVIIDKSYKSRATKNEKNVAMYTTG